MRTCYTFILLCDLALTTTEINETKSVMTNKFYEFLWDLVTTNVFGYYPLSLCFMLCILFIFSNTSNHQA